VLLCDTFVREDKKSFSTFSLMSEGVKVNVENMDANITSSATTTTTAMTEAIHDETSNDGMKEQEEEKVREIKVEEGAIRTTMSIPTLLLSLPPLENINTSVAPEGREKCLQQNMNIFMENSRA
jgi:hypothetical protein